MFFPYLCGAKIESSLDMDALKAFLIPVSGLKIGVHQFDFQIDSDFFQAFEASLIKEGNFQVSMGLDKRSDMILLDFDIKGRTPTACDRCLAAIQMPIKGKHQLIAKYAEEGVSSEAELVYISRDENSLDVSKFIYEYICLSVPLIKTYDCENEEELPCNEDLLDILDSQNATQQDGDKEDPPSNPIWDALKDLK